MVNFNGNLLPDGSPFFNQKNRGLRYGDALSESLRVVDGKLIFWEDHYLKLMASMRILRMEIPMNFTMEFLEDQVLKTIDEYELGNSTALANIIVFRNSEGALLPEKNEVSFCIEVHELASSEHFFHDTSYEVELFKDFFSSGDMLSTLPSNNKMLYVVGSIYAKENEYDDCLLLNHDKMVIGSLVGNLFLISTNTIKTAPLADGCLNTVIRDKVIKIINDSGDFEFEENSISPFELQKADELFIINVEQGLVPITKYRKKEFVTANSKKVFERLNEMILLEKAP